MWSRIAGKKDDETIGEIITEETITTVEVPTSFDLEFKRNIKKFISIYIVLEIIF